MIGRTRVVAATVLPLVLAVPLGRAGATARAASATVVLPRDGAGTTVTVAAPGPAELLLDLTLSSPGVDWARAGAESAVVSVRVDGRHTTDVLALGEEPLPRTVALGRVGPGVHEVALAMAGDRSPPGAREAHVADVVPRLVPLDAPESVPARHAPILFGRRLLWRGSSSQNTRTDTPLVGWHERRPTGTPGRHVLEYSLVLSGEDGGTDPPASMARWGRTTDIEWVYRVEVDERGDRVPGTAAFQAPGHRTRAYTGRFEHDHPLLRTCSSNNNFCVTEGSGLRFFLAYEATRPADRAREAMMDAQPWTYAVMAKELVRERRLERVPDPLTPGLGDPRSYLYLEATWRTTGPPPRPGAVRLALDVRLHGDPTVYRSDHGRATWAVERDGPVATAVELPAGTTSADVAEVIGRRVVTGADPGTTVTVGDVRRGFLLDAAFLPQPSFVRATAAAVLTPQQPTALLWSAPRPA